MEPLRWESQFTQWRTWFVSDIPCFAPVTVCYTGKDLIHRYCGVTTFIQVHIRVPRRHCSREGVLHSCYTNRRNYGTGVLVMHPKIEEEHMGDYTFMYCGSSTTIRRGNSILRYSYFWRRAFLLCTEVTLLYQNCLFQEFALKENGKCGEQIPGWH